MRRSEVEELCATGTGRYAAVGGVLKTADAPRIFARWTLLDHRFRLKLPSRHHFAFLTAPVAASRDEIMAEMNRFLQASRT